MTTTYHSITIGPILGTLFLARKTRELWAGSYFFSYLIREITKDLNNNLGNCGSVILPSTALLNDVNLVGAGLYPDRIYVESTKGKEVDVEKIIKKSFEHVIQTTSQLIYKDLENVTGAKIGKEGTYVNPFSEFDCLKCLNQYIKLYSGKVEITNGDNIIENLSSVADILDLQPRFQTVEKRKSIDDQNDTDNFPIDDDNRSPLQRFFYLANWSFLFEDGFGVRRPEFKPNETRQFTDAAFQKQITDIKWRKLTGIRPKRSFDSLIEIASRELRFVKHEDIYEQIIKEHIHNIDNIEDFTIDNSDAEEAIIQAFRKAYNKNGNKLFMDYHKYIVIIHADGDNIGKIVKAVGNTVSDIPRFSNALLEYSAKATEIVVKYGGAPVYMGGDEMLFFAPVCNRNVESIQQRKTIFELIDDLDKNFEEDIAKKFKKDIDRYYSSQSTPQNEKVYPTLSYGLAITFHKFPLYEAIKMSSNLLREIKNNYLSEKNTVNIKLMKHSGQLLPINISKSLKNNTNLWNAFLALIASTNNSTDFLSSFTYKAHTLKPLIAHAARISEERLHHLFRNSFNENYKTNEIFYKTLVTFIYSLQQFNGHLLKEEFELLYGTLRFIHFIHNNTTQYEPVV